MKRTYHFLPKSAKSQGSSWSWRLRTRADERLEELLCDLGLRVTASDCEGCFWAEWIWVEWLEFQRSSATQMMLLAFGPIDTDSWEKTKTITNKTRCFCMSFFSSFFCLEPPAQGPNLPYVFFASCRWSDPAADLLAGLGPRCAPAAARSVGEANVLIDSVWLPFNMFFF